MLTVLLKTEGNTSVTLSCQWGQPALSLCGDGEAAWDRRGGRHKGHMPWGLEICASGRGRDSTLLCKHLLPESRTAKMSIFTRQPVGRVAVCLSIRTQILGSLGGQFDGASSICKVPVLSLSVSNPYCSCIQILIISWCYSPLGLLAAQDRPGGSCSCPLTLLPAAAWPGLQQIWRADCDSHHGSCFSKNHSSCKT